ncbi:GntR family transcriptional regulator [Acidaminobacter sp. JC074]|uniref:GntR family transcriptional regulator n=1 Tax=Acidaminobacter sp. JC074 TaxID=2530199 RepID=UPI001F0D6582|nr:GntR family transcriptional regulator [Acidaminobacter sp. JC074]MCH4886426.1 GntR family transcriptional regulator [Acidaminobacter sp. JC074]
MASKRETSTQYIYKLLRQDIVNGVYKGKEKLRELDLSETYNTSTTPVREAMNRLVSEGFLESIPYKGVYIKEYTIDDVYEAYWIYNRIQVQYFERAFRTLSDQALGELENLLKEGLVGDQEIHIYERMQKFFNRLKTLTKSSILESCLKGIYAVINLESGIRDSKYIEEEVLHDLYRGVLKGFNKRDLTIIEFYFCKLTELTSCHIKFADKYDIKM